MPRIKEPGKPGEQFNFRGEYSYYGLIIQLTRPPGRRVIEFNNRDRLTP
jgi:hypothetical protein